jgi:hypothetical protein
LREERLRAAARHPVTIAVGADAITVWFSDECWAAGFAARYAEMLAPSRPRVVHYVVRTRRGYLFWSPGGQAWAWDQGLLSESAVVFLADATAIAALIRSSRLVSFHAAAIRYRGIAAAIAGASTAGKTTTVIACGYRGMGIYSDERCVLREDLVVSFPRTLRVRIGTLGGLPNVGNRDAVNLPISLLLGPGAIPAPAPLRAMFLLSGFEPQPRVAPATWLDLAPDLLQSMDSKDQGVRRLVRLADVLREVRCFRLFLGAPDASASLIAETLAGLDRRDLS